MFLICCCTTKSLRKCYSIFLLYQFYENVFWCVVVAPNLWRRKHIFITCCSTICQYILIYCCSTKFMRKYFDLLLFWQIYDNIIWSAVVLPNLWQYILIYFCSTKFMRKYSDLLLFYRIYEKIFLFVVLLLNLWENILFCCSTKSIRKHFEFLMNFML